MSVRVRYLSCGLGYLNEVPFVSVPNRHYIKNEIRSRGFADHCIEAIIQQT